MKRGVSALFRAFSKKVKPYPQVFTWGCGDNGRLGHNSNKAIPLPRSIPRNWFRDFEITQVAAGGGHSFALTESSGTFCWGNNFHGQLGIGDDVNSLGPYYCDSEVFSSFVDISCGYEHTVAISESGELYSWGRGGNMLQASPLGHKNKRSLKTPKQIGIEGEFVQCSAGDRHSAAVTVSGELYTWGDGSYGRLGLGNNKTFRTPQKVPQEFFGDAEVVKVDLGENHSGALTVTGDLYMFGRNDDYKLGVESTASLVGGASFDAQATPVLLDFGGKKVADFSCGEEFTAMVTECGEAWVWGKNIIDPPLLNVKEISNARGCSVGTNHIIFVTDNGTHVMGYTNWHGQMGLTDKVLNKGFNIKSVFKIDGNKYVPKRFVDVQCGDNYAIGIMEE